jgi:hypothetical protein
MVVCPDEENCTAYGEHYRRAQEGKCIRCGNWPQICGHDLPFAERIKSIAVDRTSLRVK